MPTKIPDIIAAEARRLHADWNVAHARYYHDDSTPNFHAEQRAYDALVDYVEANDLNYTQFDPRGPEEAQQP